MDNYVKVKQRLATFLEKEGYTMETYVAHVGKKKSAMDSTLEVPYVIMKAVIKDGEGRVISTGHKAEEHDPTDKINKFNYVANAETSACGRALDFLGITDNSKDIANKEEIKESQRKNDEHHKKQKLEQGKKMLEDAVARITKEELKVPEKKYYTEADIPMIKPPTGTKGRLKPERESIVDWLKKEGLDQRSTDITTAMVMAKVAPKYKKFSDMILKADHSEFVEVLKFVEKK